MIARPYTILVDTAEQQPFTFVGIFGDMDEELQEIDVRWRYSSLGRHPNGLGDYTIDGLFGRVHVERKSCQDLISTVLGFNDGRRGRFEQELENLSKIEAAMVVCEATIPQVLAETRDTYNRSAEVNRKILHRSILAYIMDYRVGWYFGGSRRMAEVATFRFLDRFFYKVVEGKSRANKRRV